MPNRKVGRGIVTLLLLVALSAGGVHLASSAVAGERELDGALRELRQNPESDTAWKKLLKMAEQGNAEAQYAVAHHYLWQLNNEPEYKKWERRAAESGNENAQISIASELGNAGKNKEAVAWIRRWALEKREWAEFYLARFYGEGRAGLPKDYRKALEWYEKALYGHLQKQKRQNAGRRSETRDKSREGGVLAMQEPYAEIGELYRKGGHGIKRDPVRAYACYRVAAILYPGVLLVPNPEPHLPALKEELSPDRIALADRMAKEEIAGVSRIVRDSRRD